MRERGRHLSVLTAAKSATAVCRSALYLVGPSRPPKSGYAEGGWQECYSGATERGEGELVDTYGDDAMFPGCNLPPKAL